MRQGQAVLVVTFLVGALYSQVAAQTATNRKLQMLPAGRAEDITLSEFQAAAAVHRRGQNSVVDMLRLFGINHGEYYIGVALLHRPKTPVGGSKSAEEHRQITEVYNIISGSGTLVTGGTIVNGKEETNPYNVRIGPSISGTLQGGVERKLGPGDMVVIPPMTPHGWRVVTSDQVVYSVIRIDPHHVLAIPSSPASMQ